LKRVLFVDDEQNVLDGTRRVLHGLRSEWDMHFVDSASRALEVLDAGGRFDVVVSDMRMPGMDGAELLEQVQRLQPGIVRVIFSGRAEVEYALRMATCAHQFLTKPCDPAVLKAVITRSIALHKMLRDEHLRDVVGRMRTLPALPRT
jgi:DNA-binding NtrC family response regulator